MRPVYRQGETSVRPEAVSNDCSIREERKQNLRFRPQYYRHRLGRYAKCGVIITELLPATVQQPALWSELDRERLERARKTMDKLNATLGCDTVRILSADPREAGWKLRAEYRSPRWTRWDELPRARAI